MHLFYTPELEITSKTCILSEDESKHAIRVLRLKIGDEVALLNGKGGKFTAVIINNNAKHVDLKIEQTIQDNKPDFEIHIAIAPTKNMDRLEWFLEKATEIGITKISPIYCKNSERKQLKTDRLQKILISAMKQSQRSFLPILAEEMTFDQFLLCNPNGAIAHCYAGEKIKLDSELRPRNFPILIGPEGDFSQIEVEKAIMSGYKSITLGINRLRTETAALYVCMLAQNKLES